MSIVIRRLVLLAQVALSGACVTLPPVYRAHYDIRLVEVERPAQARERYGEQTITRVSEGDTLKDYFEDGLVRIAWAPSPRAFYFVLQNKTGHSIKIVWDEAAFVDAGGQSHRIIHSGVPYAQASAPQPPSVVVRGGMLTDLVLPASHVRYESGLASGWREDPIFPDIAADPRSLQFASAPYVGKTVQVLLPIEIQGVVNEYLFSFQVESVVVPQTPINRGPAVGAVTAGRR